MYVGIDVSKEQFDACGIGDEGKKIFSVSCSMNREGFEKFVVQLTARSTASLLLGMESTASYPIALFSYLTAKGYRVASNQPIAHCKLREALLEKNEDRQEGCLYHRPVPAAEGGPGNRIFSPYRAQRSVQKKGAARRPDDVAEERYEADPLGDVPGTGDHHGCLYESNPSSPYPIPLCPCTSNSRV
jgi:hypothetical protein